MKATNTRLRKRELFHRLGYVPHPAQELVHRSKATRRIVACGVRFGKSTIGVHEGIAALMEPGERTLGWLVAPTYDLTNRIFRRVVETLHTNMPHRVLRLDARERSITVANLGGGESELRAKSADRPVSLLGEALDFAIIDEAAKLREDVWTEHLAPRLLDRGGWSLALSTPDGGGWFHQEFRRAKTDDGYAVWSFPTSENPRISPELIEAERKRLPPEAFSAQYLGEFVDVPVEVCLVCEGPTNSPRTIVLWGDEEPAHCVECGELVDDEGKSAVPLWGKPGDPARIILIRGEEIDPPPMP